MNPPPSTPTLAEMLATLATGEGFSSSRLPEVKFMRSSAHVARAPIAYQPSIVIVAQGIKRGHLGGRSFIYDSSNYLILSVPLPFECETEGTPEEPMLGVSITVTPAMVADLLMQMALPATASPDLPRSIRAIPLDSDLRNAAVRLVQALGSENDAKILGSQIIREIVYRVLQQDEEGTLRLLGAPHTHFGQISRILQKIHRHYPEPMDMKSLATEAGMSVSTFHGHFKAVTNSSPLQYLKNIRLHKARMLMVNDGANAASAARMVGYESPSQFSREFKRYFGDGPAAEAQRLRDSLVRLS